MLENGEIQIHQIRDDVLNKIYNTNVFDVVCGSNSEKYYKSRLLVWGGKFRNSQMSVVIGEVIFSI